MARIDVPLERVRFGATLRRDAWWQGPLLWAVAFAVGAGYLTWGLFQPDNYWAPPYLTPLASPLFFGVGPHALLGPDKPAWWPAAIPLLPGLLIGAFPLTFRATCYYYRGSYYKSFFVDPPSCAVGEPGRHYGGETKFPFILQNLHRYTLYFGVALIAFLTYDVVLATRFPVAPGATQTTFGLGLGTIIMAVNVALAASYTFGCHAFRHLVGGARDALSGAPLRKKAYDCSSCLNRRHGLFAMASLYSMVTTDLYIRLCAAGVIHDLRIF
jgi:hypothetical protein